MAEANPVAEKHRQRDESREPEQHCQGLCAQDAELVGEGREAPWREEEVEEREERKDGGEEEEVDLRGRVGVVGVRPPVRDLEGLAMCANADARAGGVG